MNRSSMYLSMAEGEGAGIPHDRFVDILGGAQCPRLERHDVAPWRQLADRWAASGHPEGLLIAGNGLSEASTWARENAAEVTDVDREYLGACHDAQSYRSRARCVSQLTNGLMVVAVLAALVGFRLWIGAVDEVDRSRSAMQDEAVARATAEALATSEAELKFKAQATQTAVARRLDDLQQRRLEDEVRFLAGQALWAGGDDRDTGILVGIEAIRRAQQLDRDADSLTRIASLALYQAMGHPGAGGPEGLTLFRVWPSSGGAILAQEAASAEAGIWRRAGAEAVTILRDVNAEIRDAAWSPCGTRVATVDANGRVVAWDATGANAAVTMADVDADIRSIQFSHDGLHILGRDREGRARMWDARTGEEREIAGAGAGRPSAWSHDGTSIAAPHVDGGIGIWAIGSGELVARLQSSESECWTLSWSADDATISAEMVGAEVTRHWDASSGQVLAGAPAFADGKGVNDAPRTPAIMYRGALSDALYAACTEDQIWLACGQAARNLTHEEWDQYLGPTIPYRGTCPNLPAPTDQESAT